MLGHFVVSFIFFACVTVLVLHLLLEADSLQRAAYAGDVFSPVSTYVYPSMFAYQIYTQCSKILYIQACMLEYFSAAAEMSLVRLPIDN